MAEKKTLSAKQVLGDIRSGMSDDELRNKYALSSKGLQSLLTKMVAAELLKQSELETRSKLSVETVNTDGEISEPSSRDKIPHALRDNTPTKGANQELGTAETQATPISIQNVRKRHRVSAKAILGLLLFGVVLVLAFVLLLAKHLTRAGALVIVRLFLDFAMSFAIWLLISCLVAFIIAKIRKAKSNKPYFRKAAWMALVISILATIPATERTFRLFLAQRARIPSEQVIRYEKIYKGVIQDQNFLTPQVHQEFWGMLNAEGLSSAQIKDLREQMSGVITVYQPLFWQDALKSLESGQPCKSPQREDCEKRMLKKGIMTIDRIRTNDELIAKIAAREAVTRDGQSLVFKEDMIEPILANVQEAANRVDQLFTPPQK